MLIVAIIILCSVCTEEDQLARLVMSECGVCRYEEKVKTASVVYNRSKNKNFPNTITGVIQQSKQFHGYLTRNYWIKPNKESRLAAEQVLMCGPVTDALYFVRLDRTNSPWIYKKDWFFEIGDYHHYSN